MHRSILLAAVLAGGLTLAAAAEADGRHGRHGGPGRMFHHGPQFAQPSSLRLFAPPSSRRLFAPGHRGRHVGHRHGGPRFGHRDPVLRFVTRQPVPLSLQPGYRILAGRRILPLASVPLARPIVVPRSPRFPSFVRIGPSPGLPPAGHGFGIPHRSGGLTIIVRDPGAMPSWR